MQTRRKMNRWNMRGIMRAMAMFAGVTLATTSFVRAGPSTQPSADEIIAKYIDASGGKEAYASVKSRIAHGKVAVPAQGMNGTLDLYFASPDRIRAEVEVPGVEKSETVFDGKHGWEKSAMRGTRLLKGEELDRLRQQADVQSQLDWKKEYSSANNDGIVDMDGKGCYKVTMTPKTGKPEIRYYDTQSGLLDAVETESEMMGTSVHILSKLSDYRDAGGIKMPFATSMEMSVNGMQVEQNLTLDKVDVNSEIPADKFQMPDDVKKLLENPTSGPAEKATSGKATPGKGKPGK